MINYWVLGVRRLLVFSLLPLAVGLAIGVAGWIWKQDAGSLLSNLREVDGRVLKMTPVPDGTELEVEFLTEEGLPYKKAIVVDDRQARDADAVGKLSLIHDRRDPATAAVGHVVSAYREWLFYWSLVVLGALLTLWGLAVVARQGRAILRIGRLFHDGQLTQTEIRDSTIAPGGVVGRFTYAFRGPDGRWYEGKSPDLPAAQLAQWPVGKRLTVAYDTRNPRESEPDIFGIVAANRSDAELPV